MKTLLFTKKTSKEEAEEDEKSPFHEEDANKDPEPEPEAGVGS